MSENPKRSWRDVLPIHPAAERIPEATEEEKRALAADLARHGLRVPVVLVPVPGEPGRRCLLDGRTRLDLLEAAGKQVVDTRGRLLVEHKVARPKDKAEAERLSLSLNVHRRHLTAEQKRAVIAALLKAKPESSDNAIAKQVKADDKTVAKVRRGLEARSEIPNVKARTDTKGRKQPAKKPPRSEESRRRTRGPDRPVIGIGTADQDDPESLDHHNAETAAIMDPIYYEQAVEAVDKMREETRAKFFAYLKRTYPALENQIITEAGRSATGRAPRSPPRSVVKAIADRAEARSAAANGSPHGKPNKPH